MTNEIIISIDTENAVDLDDALSVKVTNDLNVVEIGVHISDVSHFI